MQMNTVSSLLFFSPPVSITAETIKLYYYTKKKSLKYN